MAGRRLDRILDHELHRTKLRSWGYEVLLGTKIINPEQVFGRNEKLVQEGIKNALTRGVSQSFIDETEGIQAGLLCLTPAKKVRPLLSVSILTAFA